MPETCARMYLTSRPPEFAREDDDAGLNRKCPAHGVAGRVKIQPRGITGSGLQDWVAGRRVNTGQPETRLFSAGQSMRAPPTGPSLFRQTPLDYCRVAD